MKFILALLCLLLASPAFAMNELQGAPLAKVQEMAAAQGANLEKLNEADTATMDAATGQRPLPSTIYLLTIRSSVILLLEHDGIVVLSTDPAPLETVNKVLGRTDA